MAASVYKIPKGTRVGVAKRFRLTVTIFVLAKAYFGGFAAKQRF
jgi:hypothetical protein